MRIGADGTGWAKAGVECFDRAKYQLDEFHLRKALRETLGHDAEGYRAVAEALRRRDREKFVRALLEVGKRTIGHKKREDIREFEIYVLGNWEGIKGSTQNLGTIEGQVYHILAWRMKRLGARWTPEGANRMARLLAAKANGELGKYSTARVKHAPRLTPPITPNEPVRSLDKKTEEIGAWLQARVPALPAGFFVGKGTLPGQ